MEIRIYRPEDCPAMAELFRASVRTAAVDYTPAQRLAWAPDELDLAAWDRSFRAHVTLTAWEDGRLIGFGDADPAGYLDRLYVHPDHLRRGVATALCDRLEAAVTAGRVRVDASITARPFFAGRGYRQLREQQVLRRGVWLTNFAMEKRLEPSAGQGAGHASGG